MTPFEKKLTARHKRLCKDGPCCCTLPSDRGAARIKQLASGALDVQSLINPARYGYRLVRGFSMLRDDR